MNYKNVMVVVLLTGLSLFADETQKASIMEITDSKGNDFALIEINDFQMQSQMLASLSKDHSNVYYVQKDSYGYPTGPVLIPKSNRKVMRREVAGRDIGIGSGLCLGGCLFVSLAGKEKSQMEQPQGFYAMVGTKVVEGAPACLVAAMWITGIVFIVKGVIQLFLHKESDSNFEDIDESSKPLKKGARVISVAGIDSKGPLSAEQIVNQNNYKIKNRIEKKFEKEDAVSYKKWVEKYCLSY